MHRLAPTSPAALSYASEMEAIVSANHKDKTLLSTTDAGKILDCHPQTVRRLMGQFKTAKLVAGSWVIEKWEVEQFAKDHPGKYRKLNR